VPRTPPLALLAALAAWLGAPAAAHAAAHGQRVPVLVYHHVGTPPAGTAAPGLWVSRARFAAQVRALRRAGHTAVTLDRVRRAWRGLGRLPARPVVLTFDDGYADQRRGAAPVLARAGWPGVLFLTEANVDRPHGIAAQDVRALLRAGWELGGHTATHPDLRTVDDARLAAEVDASRAALRRAFGVPVRAFAYPYGRADARVAGAVRAAGYLTAWTTRRAVARRGTRATALPRVVVGSRTTPAQLLARIR
jgi:peptidoglycan/xylan/chitin deacetylase (PgdA/CDA1 family)